MNPIPRSDTCTTDPTRGQYVYIYKAGTNIRFSLCEVEVYGTAGTLSFSSTHFSRYGPLILYFFCLFALHRSYHHSYIFNLCGELCVKFVRAFLFSVSACLSLSSVLCFVCLFGYIIACSLFFGKKTPCALDTVKMILKFLFRVEPCCAGLFSLFFSLRSLVLFLGEEKKFSASFRFIYISLITITL